MESIFEVLQKRDAFNICLFTMSDVPIPFWHKIAALHFIVFLLSHIDPNNTTMGKVMRSSRSITIKKDGLNKKVKVRLGQGGRH
jgi:hypothetical protein